MTITPEEIARLRTLAAHLSAFDQWSSANIKVAALNALPRLLDEIERLRAASADYCESCGWLMKFPDGCANCESVRLRADLREAVALLDGWASPSGHVEEWNRRVGALLAKHKEDA